MLTETPATNQLTGEKYFFSLHPDFVLTLHHVSDGDISFPFTTSIFAFKAVLAVIQPTLKLNPLNYKYPSSPYFINTLPNK